MKPEDKELLFKDLSGRLPYHVRCKIWLEDGTTEEGPLDLQHNYGDVLQDAFYYDRIKDIKPYLRPMSSMTEEEVKEFYDVECMDAKVGYIKPAWNWHFTVNGIDWLNKNMFDFRGLIPKGLAEIAPEGMYELKLLDNHLPSQNESDSEIDNTTKITVGCKIRSKTNPNEILSIISDDCHGDEFECADGSVLSLKQIEKYYELIK